MTDHDPPDESSTRPLGDDDSTEALPAAGGSGSTQPAEGSTRPAEGFGPPESAPQPGPTVPPADGGDPGSTWATGGDTWSGHPGAAPPPGPRSYPGGPDQTGQQPGGGQWGQWPPPPPGAYGQGYGYGGPGYGGPGYGYGPQAGYGWGPQPQPQQQPQRGRHSTLLAIIGVAALVLLAAAVGGIAGHDMKSTNSSTTSPAPSYYSFGGSSGDGSGGSSGDGSGSSGSSTGAGAPSDVSSIAAKVSPALVDINVTFSYQQAQGAGTGIVLTPTGEILTNNHVIDGATAISVTDIGNGKTYKGSVVGYDPTHDLAVVQLTGASGLKTANIGNSSKLATGQGVVGIGNAGGSGGTPSSAGGSITALNQSISAGDELDGTTEQLTGLIQTNADIQAGDSGGSLVNSNGEVIGVDVAASNGFSFGGQSEGGSSSGGTQGYAIPINQAIATAKQIEAKKTSATVHIGDTAFLGVLVSTGSSSQGGDGSFGSGGSSGSSNGATVSSTVAGGAAAAAGLAKGDVITSFDGKSVTTPTSLSKLLLPLHPGDKVPLTYTDTEGASHTVTVTLGSGPPA